MAAAHLRHDPRDGHGQRQQVRGQAGAEDGRGEQRLGQAEVRECSQKIVPKLFQPGTRSKSNLSTLKKSWSEKKKTFLNCLTFLRLSQ